MTGLRQTGPVHRRACLAFVAVVAVVAVLVGACASSSGDDRAGARSDPTTSVPRAFDRLLADAAVPGLTTVLHDAG